MSSSSGDDFDPFSSSASESPNTTAHSPPLAIENAQTGEADNSASSASEVPVLEWQVRQLSAQQADEKSFGDPFSSSSESHPSPSAATKTRTRAIAATERPGDSNPSPNVASLPFDLQVMPHSLQRPAIMPLSGLASFSREAPSTMPSGLMVTRAVGTMMQGGQRGTLMDPTSFQAVQSAARGLAVRNDESLGESASSAKPKAPPPTSTSRATDPNKAAASQKFSEARNKQWKERYDQLARFVKENGHACPPPGYSGVLTRWMKRQRAQRKEKLQGKPSTMSDKREEMLNQIGFVWDSRDTVWHERFIELLQFRSLYGHCNVPATFEANQQLSVWVKSQRRQFKLWRENQRSSMTEYRHKKLLGVGFIFAPNAP